MSKATLIALGALCFLTGHVGIIMVGMLLLSSGLLMPAEDIRQQVRDLHAAQEAQRLAEAQEAEPAGAQEAQEAQA
jgi:hypothetical protein